MSRMLCAGRWAHATTVEYSKSGSDESAIANHKPSGTSATAVRRCAHQCSPAPFAAPSPSTRFNGVTKLTLIYSRAKTSNDGEPAERRGRHHGHDDHGPTARRDLRAIESLADVPR